MNAAEEDAAFAAMVQAHSKFVFRVAYSVLRNAHDAEDVVQETFLKLYRNRGWRKVENEKAFLARAVWRLAVDRRPKRRGESPGDVVASGGDDPEQAAIRVDWNRVVQKLVDALPEELRLPLALSAVEEMSSGEIAEVMGIPAGTVRTRLLRARQMLREKLEALHVQR